MSIDLAARIEAASQGSRELSDAVLEVCGFKRVEDAGSVMRPISGWRSPSGFWYPDGQQPDPTRSETDAFALCGDAEVIVQTWVGLDGQRYARATVDSAESETCATPALALSAALVRAREQR